MSYDTSRSNRNLDVELPIYIHWEQDSDDGIQQYTTPVLLSDQKWFADEEGNYHGEFVVEAVGLGDDPYDMTETPDRYARCPEGQILEEPLLLSTPLDDEGRIRIRDVHGGIGSKTTIILVRNIPNPDPDCFCALRTIAVVLGWEAPGTRQDHDPSTHTVNVLPGDTLNQIVEVRGTAGAVYRVMCPRMVVHWVSADFAPASPGIMDSADWAVFGPHYGKEVRWGFSSEQPANDPNYFYNVTTYDNSINSSDLSLLGLAWGTQCELTTSKADEDEWDRVLAWFGIEATGETIVVDGNTIPEYDIADLEQNRRANADPYGWQEDPSVSSSVERSPWFHIKELYR